MTDLLNFAVSVDWTRPLALVCLIGLYGLYRWASPERVERPRRVPAGPNNFGPAISEFFASTLKNNEDRIAPGPHTNKEKTLGRDYK